MLAFLGDRGNGKTQMGIALIKHVIRTEKIDIDSAQWGKPPMIGLYVRAREIGMMLRECYKQTSTLTEKQAVDQFCHPKILVIDECQERPDSDFEQKSLTLILDKRYGAMKPTVMIANCDDAAFRKVIGASAVDRLRENGGILPFDWPSFRG